MRYIKIISRSLNLYFLSLLLKCESIYLQSVSVKCQHYHIDIYDWLCPNHDEYKTTGAMLAYKTVSTEKSENQEKLMETYCCFF